MHRCKTPSRSTAHYVGSIVGRNIIAHIFRAGKGFRLASRSCFGETRCNPLRRAIQLHAPSARVLQDLLPFCENPLPFPSFEGEMTSTAQTGRAKEGNLIGIKGRYFPADTRIDTLDDPTLARLIVRHEKPLTLDGGYND